MMALKADDQYEYRTCTSCGKNKKVHVDNELLLDKNEWIKDNSHLPDEKYKGLCVRCTGEELEFGWRKATHERLEAEGKPIPNWLWKEKYNK